MKRTGILRPGLLATVVLTALVMLGAGWAGAFAGARLSLEHAPDLPSGAEARQLSATAFPGLRVFGGGNAPAIEPYEDGEGVKYGSVSYWVKHTEQTRDVAAYTASARDRLAAAGWQVHDYQVEPPEDLIDGGASYRATFWATKPGLMLAFADDYWTGRPSYDSTGAASFDLWRTPPAFMDDAAVAGAAAGALLALLLSVWVTRRLRSVPARRATVGGWTVVGLVMLLPTLMTPGEEYPMQSPWFAGFYYFGLLPAMGAAGIAVLIMLFAAARYPAIRAAGRATFGLARRRPKVVAAAVVLALIAAALPAVLRRTGIGYEPCRPAGIPAEPAAARDSTHVKIFIANTSTDQERALIDAAIFRSRAGSLGELIWQPDSAGFRETYCGGGPVPASAAASLPYYFDMDLSDATTLPALLEEVNGLAGVLAVRRALPTT